MRKNKTKLKSLREGLGSHAITSKLEIIKKKKGGKKNVYMNSPERFELLEELNRDSIFFFFFFFAFPSYISGVHHFWVRFLRM